MEIPQYLQPEVLTIHDKTQQLIEPNKLIVHFIKVHPLQQLILNSFKFMNQLIQKKRIGNRRLTCWKAFYAVSIFFANRLQSFTIEWHLIAIHFRWKDFIIIGWYIEDSEEITSRVSIRLPLTLFQSLQLYSLACNGRTKLFHSFTSFREKDLLLRNSIKFISLLHQFHNYCNNIS